MMKISAYVIVFSCFISQVCAASQESKMCTSGVSSQNALSKISISKSTDADGIVSESSVSKVANTTGKCYKIAYSQFVYLVDKQHVIYKVTTDDYLNPLVMLDFGAANAKHKVFKGVVKGAGTFNYKDGRGLSRTIPRMVVVEEQNQR